MKIALDVSQVIYGTGVSKYTKNLVSHLLRIDDKNEYTLFGGSLRRKGELDTWINRLPEAKRKTFYLSPYFLHLAWNTFHFLPAEVLTGTVDLLHTSDWAEPPTKMKKVTTVHDLNFLIDPAFAHPQIRQVQTKRLFWVSKESAGIIAVSQATKKDLIEHLDIPSDRIEVIHEGPTIQYRPEVSQEELALTKKKFDIDRPFVVIPGAGHPRKNITRAIAAFKQSKLEYQLVVLGLARGEEKRLASSQIIFTGFVSDRDYEILLSNAQLLLYPSLYEGFGLPVLDAFICGVPVVTSNCSSLPEVAGEAAILVDPQSTESIALGIIKALKQAGTLVQAGQHRASKFSWKRTAQETLAFYQKVQKQ
jgi:glycosyltransferase involved in cell wall biosynthesis